MSHLPEPTAEAEPAQATSTTQKVAVSTTVFTEWEGVWVGKRLERHAAVHELLAKGVGISAIAEALSLDRKTVRRYAKAATPEDRSAG